MILRIRARYVVLIVLAVLLAFPTYFVVRAKVFPPTFDVVSIKETATYQDPALMARAWDLPVARTYAHTVVFQSNGSVCGPDSAANVFRSMGMQATTEAAVLEGTGKCPWGFCIPGITLDDLAAIVRQRSSRPVTVLRDTSLAEFRAHMRETNDPAHRYMVNFHRGLLFGKGVGHHSPVAGYLEDRDLVFVLDVNPSFGPWLVPTERLYEASKSIDSSSGKPRGLLRID
jgi:hypothetical protein